MVAEVTPVSAQRELIHRWNEDARRALTALRNGINDIRILSVSSAPVVQQGMRRINEAETVFDRIQQEMESVLER